MIANQCGMKSHEVYQTLKGLSEKHILHFIPRKQVPYIRYMQRREDSEHVRVCRRMSMRSA